MKRTLFLPLAAQDKVLMRRYGFHCAIQLLLADALGGLWHVSEQGIGRELDVPYRACTVADYERYATAYQQNRTLGFTELCLSISEAEPDMTFGAEENSALSFSRLLDRRHQ